jgi:hypothetical protein
LPKVAVIRIVLKKPLLSRALLVKHLPTFLPKSSIKKGQLSGQNKWDKDTSLNSLLLAALLNLFQSREADYDHHVACRLVSTTFETISFGLAKVIKNN